jgi:hypothetical protein
VDMPAPPERKPAFEKIEGEGPDSQHAGPVEKPIFIRGNVENVLPTALESKGWTQRWTGRIVALTGFIVAAVALMDAVTSIVTKTPSFTCSLGISFPWCAAAASKETATTKCDGMPGETAWIYGGEFNGLTGSARQGPFVVSDPPGTLVQDIRPGSWIKLTEARKTMILDYSTRGLDRAMDSPFRLDGKVSYTCKSFPAGQRLYVAGKEINGPEPDIQHVWFRIRLTPPGG